MWVHLLRHSHLELSSLGSSCSPCIGTHPGHCLGYFWPYKDSLMARASPHPEELPLLWLPEGAPCAAEPQTRLQLCPCVLMVRPSAVASVCWDHGKTSCIQPTPIGSALIICWGLWGLLGPQES